MLVSLIGIQLFGSPPPLNFKFCWKSNKFAENPLNSLLKLVICLDYEFSLQVKNHQNREILIVSHPPHLGNLQNEPNIRRVPGHPTDLSLLQ